MEFNSLGYTQGHPAPGFGGRLREATPPPSTSQILATLGHDQRVQIDRHDQIGTVMLELTRLGPMRGAYEAAADATLRRMGAAPGRDAERRRAYLQTFQALPRPAPRKDKVTARPDRLTIIPTGRQTLSDAPPADIHQRYRGSCQIASDAWNSPAPLTLLLA
jgi:hypothetical protein